MLHIFERPLWTYHANVRDNWNDPNEYPSFDMDYLSPIAVNVLEALCLCVLWMGVSLELVYKQYTSNSYLSYVSATVLTIKSIGVLICIVKLGQGLNPTFSMSPVEALMCLLVEVQYDNNIGYIRRTVPKFCVLMLALGAFIVAYTIMGFLIFNPDSEEAKVYFPTTGTGIWNMLMVVNASNWPSPMIPAYNDNRLYCIYFYTYILIADWGLLNLVLGFVYLFFQREQKSILEMQEQTRVDNKAAAFRILDVEKKGFLTYAQVDDLLKEMYEYFEADSFPPSAAERYELILILDSQSRMLIDEDDFAFIEKKCLNGALKVMRAKKSRIVRYVRAHILKQHAALSASAGAAHTAGSNATSNRTPLPSPTAPADTNPMHVNNNHTTTTHDESSNVSNNPHNAEHPRASVSPSTDSTNGAMLLANEYAGLVGDPKLLELYRDIETEQLSQLNLTGGLTYTQRAAMLGMYIDSIYFDIITDTFMLLLGLIVLIDPSRTDRTYVYITFGLCEMLVKLAAKGYFGFRSSKRCRIDSFVTIVLIALVISNACVEGSGYAKVGTKALILLRTLAYPRNIYATNGFKEFRSRQRLAMAFALKGASHFSFLLLVLVVMMYAFSGIGVLLFGGVISRTGPGSGNVASSDYGEGEYYPLNFNDMPSGIVTMFTLLMVNNMHITASGFVAAESQWAEVFFALWYAFGVLLMLNVLTAVFVDQFTGYMGHLAAEQHKAAALKRQQQLQQLKATEDSEEDAASELERSRGAGLSSDSALSTDHELRRNTLLNALPVDNAVVSAGTDAEDGFISMSRKAPTNGLLSPLRPSFVNFNPDLSQPLVLEKPETIAQQQRPESPTAFKRTLKTDEKNEEKPEEKSFGKLRSKTRLGLLTKMLSINDSIEVDPEPTVTLRPTSPAARPPSPGGRLDPDAVARRKSKLTPSVPMPVPTMPEETPFHANVRYHSESLSPGVSIKSADAQLRTSLGTSAASAGQGDTFASTPPASRGSLGLSRPRSSTLGISETETSLPATSFNASIFASASDRQVLDDWVKSHYPRPRRQSAANTVDLARSPHTPDFSPQSYLPTNEANYGAMQAAAGVLPRVASRRRSSTLLDPANQHIISQLMLPPSNSSLALDEFESSNMEEDRISTLKNVLMETKAAVLPVQTESPFRLSVPHRPFSVPTGLTPTSTTGGTQGARNSKEVELNSVPATPVEEHSNGRSLSTSAYNRSFTSSSHHAEIVASINSTQEELILLRGQDARHSFVNKFVAHTSVKHATDSLNEWMYGANQISPHEKAAVLIQFARDGEEHSIFSSPRGLACFRLRTSLAPLFKVCSLVFALLKFLQRPAWTYDHQHWSDNAVFPTSGLPQLDATVIGAIKLPLLLVLLFGFVIEIGYKEPNFMDLIRLLNPMRLARWLLLLYCIVQIFMVIVGMSAGPSQLVPLSSCGSILYVLWFNRRSLHKFRIVLRVLPRLSLVLILFLLMILLFAGCGPYLFNLRDSGVDDDLHQVYFDTFQESTWSVFVAITSSNYPNQILPAYRTSREVFVYFVVFISVGAFGVLNLILVIVLVEFQKASQLAADIQRATRHVLLIRAYEVLDPEGVGYIERSQVMLLLDELYQHYSDFKKAGVPKRAARDILVDILDVDGDGVISVQDFLYFLDVTRIKLSQDTSVTFLEKHFPMMVHSHLYQWLRAAVHFPYSNLIVDFVVSVLIIINFCFHMEDNYTPTKLSVPFAMTTVLIIVLEALAKILVLGVNGYKRSFRNRVDFVIALSALVCLIGAVSLGSVTHINVFSILMRLLLLIRLIVVPRNLRYFFKSRRLQRFSRLLRRILSKILTLSIVFLCTGYVFATIGLYAFGGVISTTPASNPHYEALVESSYGQNNFYGLNFNDFMSGCITLFSCLHVSDFDTIATGFTATTNESAKVYFTAWYVVGVLLMRNILKSFFLGEFLALFLAPPKMDQESNKTDKISPALGSENNSSRAPSTTEQRSPLQDHVSPTPTDDLYTNFNEHVDARETFQVAVHTHPARQLSTTGTTDVFGASGRSASIQQVQSDFDAQLADAGTGVAAAAGPRGLGGTYFLYFLIWV